MDNEHKNTLLDPMTAEERHSYNVLQTMIVLLDNLFCIFFVGCITWLAYTSGNSKLMWWYLLPLIAYAAV